MNACADLTCTVAVKKGVVIPVGTSRYRVTKVEIREVGLASLTPAGKEGATATLTTSSYLPVGKYQIEMVEWYSDGAAVVRVCPYKGGSKRCNGF